MQGKHKDRKLFLWYNFSSTHMKAKYYLFIILVVILGGSGIVIFDTVKNGKIDENSQSEEKNKVILYWGEGCDHCKKVEEFISQNKDIMEKIKIEKKEVGKNLPNSLELTARAKECMIDVEKGIAVPFLYFQGECVVGDQPIIDYLRKKTE